MKVFNWLAAPESRLDLVAGLIDGILTSLTLASGRLIAGSGASLGLAVRVAIATGLTNGLVFFFAHYAELRTDLVGYERQLNLTSHGKLASSALGRTALLRSFSSAAVAILWTIIGGFSALMVCVWVPDPRWAGPAIDVALLGGLGVLLARSIHGSALRWALGLMAGGALLTFAGLQLHVAA